MSTYFIAGLPIRINAAEWAMHDNFKLFLMNEAVEPEIKWNVVFKELDIPSKSRLIVKTPGTSIYENDGYLLNVCSDKEEIPSLLAISEDKSDITMYIDPKYNNPNDKKIVASVREGLFAALRDAMIASLSVKQGVIIHSSTIIWNGNGVVFSAPAGTGKTTHTRMWKKLYGTPILDGDATACRLVNGIPWVYGLPWCGTSRQFTDRSVKLGAIVFLQQAKENKIERLNTNEAFVRLVSRCFLLPWNTEMTYQFLNIIQAIVENSNCYLLNCLPDKNAVELVKKCLEES